MLGREGAFFVLVGIKKLLPTCHRQGYFTYSLLKGVLGIVHQLVISAFIGYYKGFILDFLAV